MGATLLALTALLAGCGGGGGSAPAPVPESRASNDSAATNQGVAVVINVLTNDSGVAPDSLTVSTAPANGEAQVLGQAIEYLPAAPFFGTDQFTYSVNTDSGTRVTATVSVSVNASPVAGNINVEIIENVSTPVDLLAGASDPDGALAGATVDVVSVAAGTVEADGDVITYVPPEDFIGTDSIVFRVTDDQGAGSNDAIATLNVVAVTETVTLVRALPVPTSGYATTNSPEFGGAILSSPVQTMIESTNGVSLLLALSGKDVGQEDGLLITNIIPPRGDLSPLGGEVVVCDVALCTAYLPRLPEKGSPVRGEWRFELGTTAQTLDDIDFSDVRLHVIERRGPDVDFTRPVPATITVRPVLSAVSLPEGRFDEILAEMVALAAANRINLQLRETRVLSSPEFQEVSSDFTDERTQALIRQGDPDAVNLFFLESFSGPGGQIGIAPGIPGELAVVNSYLSGALVNATVTLDDPDIHARTTAEFAIHEMGHLLGLFHTTEADFTNDILADTPGCDESDDSNNNNRPNTDECPDGLNIMFWTNALNETKQPLTDDQRFVLFHAPLATPEGPAVIVRQ